MSEQYHRTLTYPLKPVVPDAEVTIGSDTDLHEVVKKTTTKNKKHTDRILPTPNTPSRSRPGSKSTPVSLTPYSRPGGGRRGPEGGGGGGGGRGNRELVGGGGGRGARNCFQGFHRHTPVCTFIADLVTVTH